MATLVERGDEPSQAIQAANAAEVERLSVQHYVVKAAMGGNLVLAPLDLSKRGLRILDAATADGLWLRDLQSTTPSLDFHSYIGTDINTGLFPKEPTTNVTLVKQSLVDPQPEEWNGTFDLMNQRFAFAAAMGAPRQPIVNNYAGLLKSGGWLQCTEMDSSAAEGDAMIKVTGIVKQIVAMVGADKNPDETIPNLMKGAGLTDIEHKDSTVLVGPRNPDPRMAEESVKSMVMTVEGLVAASKRMPPGALGDLDDLPRWVGEDLRANGGSWKITTTWGKKA